MIKYHIAPFTSDYGFKATFGHDGLFARKAIQLLIKSDKPILRLSIQQNEFIGFTAMERTGIYDAVFKDDKKRIFIVEMQVNNYEYLIERLLYYVFHMYCSTVNKGRMGFSDLQPIYCICILEGSLTNFDGHFHKISLKNENGNIFSPLIEFDFIELGKFPFKIHEFNKITNEIDQLLYTMKHAHKVKSKAKSEDATPDFWKKDWLREALEKLDLSNMDPEQRALLDMEILRQKIFVYNQEKKIEDARVKERIAVRKIFEAEKLAAQQALEAEKAAVQQALEAEKAAALKQSIITAHKGGLAADFIAQILLTTHTYVTQVIEEYKNAQYQ